MKLNVELKNCLEKENSRYNAPSEFVCVIKIMVKRKGSGNYHEMDKTQVKLFLNFTSIPFDYLLILWVTNYVSKRGFLTCLSWITSIDTLTVSMA